MRGSHETLAAHPLAHCRRLVSRPEPGHGAGMPAEIRAMEARIKREEMHLLSGYYEQKGGPVRGGSPGSGRRS